MDAHLVEAILDDWRTAPISEKLRATLGFLEKLTLTPAEVSPADIEPMRSMGVTDQGIAEAIQVCFLFNVVDRLADAFDFEIPSADEANRVARILFNFGYAGGSVPG